MHIETKQLPEHLRDLRPRLETNFLFLSVQQTVCAKKYSDFMVELVALESLLKIKIPNKLSGWGRWITSLSPLFRHPR